MGTIEDVARRAGVSQSTVSYALSGKRSISEATRKRVERAIEELDYRPHAGARALASARTDIIGLMAPLRAGVDVNIIMQFVAGVVAGAGRSGYDILLLTQDEGSVDRVTRSSMVDALVVMDVEEDDARLPGLRKQRQPSVLIGLPGDAQGLSCVDFDFAQAGAMAVRELIASGHRSIALIGSPAVVRERHTTYADRMTRGFVDTAAKSGVDALTLPTEASAAGAAESVDRLLLEQPEVTGIVVHNEMALPHVIARLRERAALDRMSIVAVCPENVATALPVAISSIDIPAEAIGQTAVDMLIGLMKDSSHREVRLVSPQFTDRGSVHEPGSPQA